MIRNTLITASLLFTAACGSSQYAATVTCDSINVPVTTETSNVAPSNNGLSGLGNVTTVSSADNFGQSPNVIVRIATTTVVVNDYTAEFGHDGSVTATLSLDNFNPAKAYTAHADMQSCIEQAVGSAVITVTSDAKAKTVEVTVTTASSSNTYTVTSQCTFN